MIAEGRVSSECEKRLQPFMNEDSGKLDSLYARISTQQETSSTLPGTTLAGIPACETAPEGSGCRGPARETRRAAKDRQGQLASRGPRLRMMYDISHAGVHTAYCISTNRHRMTDKSSLTSPPDNLRPLSTRIPYDLCRGPGLSLQNSIWETSTEQAF